MNSKIKNQNSLQARSSTVVTTKTIAAERHRHHHHHHHHHQKKRHSNKTPLTRPMSNESDRLAETQSIISNDTNLTTTNETNEYYQISNMNGSSEDNYNNEWEEIENTQTNLKNRYIGQKFSETYQDVLNGLITDKLWVYSSNNQKNDVKIRRRPSIQSTNQSEINNEIKKDEQEDEKEREDEQEEEKEKEEQLLKSMSSPKQKEKTKGKIQRPKTSNVAKSTDLSFKLPMRRLTSTAPAFTEKLAQQRRISTRQSIIPLIDINMRMLIIKSRQSSHLNLDTNEKNPQKDLSQEQATNSFLKREQQIQNIIFNYVTSKGIDRIEANKIERLSDIVFKGYIQQNGDDITNALGNYISPKFKIKSYNTLDTKELNDAKKDLYKRYSFINDPIVKSQCLKYKILNEKLNKISI
jgi:hypothetical protein